MVICSLHFTKNSHVNTSFLYFEWKWNFLAKLDDALCILHHHSKPFKNAEFLKMGRTL